MTWARENTAVTLLPAVIFFQPTLSNYTNYYVQPLTETTQTPTHPKYQNTPKPQRRQTGGLAGGWGSSPLPRWPLDSGGWGVGGLGWGWSGAARARPTTQRRAKEKASSSKKVFRKKRKREHAKGKNAKRDRPGPSNGNRSTHTHRSLSVAGGENTTPQPPLPPPPSCATVNPLGIASPASGMVAVCGR
jgi:hypothetical protein